MAGVKGMHASWAEARSPVYAESVRARIKAGGIVKALQDHIVGKRSMEPSQVTAALGLLRKVVADRSESKIDMNMRHGPLLSVAQAAEMAEAMIESAGRTTASTSGADPVRHSESA